MAWYNSRCDAGTVPLLRDELFSPNDFELLPQYKSTTTHKKTVNFSFTVALIKRGYCEVRKNYLYCATPPERFLFLLFPHHILMHLLRDMF